MKMRSHNGKKRATVWGSTAILYRRHINNGGWVYRPVKRKQSLFALFYAAWWVLKPEGVTNG